MLCRHPTATAGLPMTDRPDPTLHLIPGRSTTTFVIRVDDALTLLTVHGAHFLEGLMAASAMLSFAELLRDDERLDDLLPWTGNV